MNLNAIKNLRGQLQKYKTPCKSGCFECCTAVPVSQEELKLMKKELIRQGYKEPPKGKGDNFCEFLTTEGKCSVYNERPIICRSFGRQAFVLKRNGTKVATQSCTHFEKELIDGSNELLQYTIDLNKSGIIIGMLEEHIKRIIAPIVSNHNPNENSN